MERMISGATVIEEKQCSLVPPEWEDSIRTVRMNESAAAGRSLAHSFATDPLSRYLLDGDDMEGCSAEAKWKLHVALMATVIASHASKGLVTTIGPDYDALAIWAPPGADTEGLWTMFRSGMLKLYFQLPAEGRKRYYREMLPLLHRTKATIMGERDMDSYYLVYIGTKPHARGRGHATRLVRDMIAKADAENRPMYLESSSLANNAFYGKFGFQVVGDILFTRGPVPVKLDVMVREPQPRKTTDSSAATSQTSSEKVKV